MDSAGPVAAIVEPSGTYGAAPDGARRSRRWRRHPLLATLLCLDPE